MNTTQSPGPQRNGRVILDKRMAFINGNNIIVDESGGALSLTRQKVSLY
jgi:hypothetical protein